MKEQKAIAGKKSPQPYLVAVTPVFKCLGEIVQQDDKRFHIYFLENNSKVYTGFSHATLSGAVASVASQLGIGMLSSRTLMLMEVGVRTESLRWMFGVQE